MSTSTVLVERLDERVTLVTLNRPEKLNAITFEFVAELHDALDTSRPNPSAG